jgi:hypothetical protein
MRNRDPYSDCSSRCASRLNRATHVIRTEAPEENNWTMVLTMLWYWLARERSSNLQLISGVHIGRQTTFSPPTTPGRQMSSKWLNQAAF